MLQWFGQHRAFSWFWTNSRENCKALAWTESRRLNLSPLFTEMKVPERNCLFLQPFPSRSFFSLWPSFVSECRGELSRWRQCTTTAFAICPIQCPVNHQECVFLFNKDVSYLTQNGFKVCVQTKQKFLNCFLEQNHFQMAWLCGRLFAKGFQEGWATFVGGKCEFGMSIINDFFF